MGSLGLGSGRGVLAWHHLTPHNTGLATGEDSEELFMDFLQSAAGGVHRGAL